MVQTVGEREGEGSMTREEAIEIINRENDPNNKEVWEVFPEYRKALDIAIKALEQEPSAQPEIIRCKDCKYWREHKYAKETKRYIPFCGFNAIYTKSDDFCSRAERREV